MKDLKLLNSLNLVKIFIFLISLNTNALSNEPEDIWSLKKKDQNLINETDLTENDNDKVIKNENTISIKKNIFGTGISFENLQLVGIYDPSENNLNLDMWSNSNGDQIKSIMKKINMLNLSDDANDILKIALLTNSYFPEKEITNEEFVNFKIKFLKKNNNLELINEYLDKNKNIPSNKLLIRHFVNEKLLSGNFQDSCEFILDNKNYEDDNYLDKFKILCLINFEKREDAQIIYDVKKEMGFDETFFDEKFNILMGYTKKKTNSISENSVLDFHISKITNSDFDYKPNENTPKFIWRYLSNYNLLEEVNNVDLGDEEKIKTLEKATNDSNYSETDLLNLYKRFQFSVDEFLKLNETLKVLPSYKGRALLYQRLLLTYDDNEKIKLIKKLKESFKNEKLENAFNLELSKLLSTIDINNISSEYTNFHHDNIISKKKEAGKIKFNNKIIHQSKLLNYFLKDIEIEKISKDTNDLLKKVKADKKYIFSNKDKMLIDSLKYDGAILQKKFENVYEQDPNIPIDLQVLINDNDIGMILLRLVEIIGEDQIEDIGTETLYFITTILNEIDLDNIRNSILLKTLPIKV